MLRKVSAVLLAMVFFAEIAVSAQDPAFASKQVKKSEGPSVSVEPMVSLLETKSFKDKFYPDCKDSPLDVKSCVPGYCKSMQLGTMVYHKIVGFNGDGLCIYRQRIEEMGVLQCQLPKGFASGFPINFTIEERSRLCSPVSIISKTFLVTLATSLVDDMPIAEEFSDSNQNSKASNVKRQSLFANMKSLMLPKDLANKL